ncbi:DUF3592 domain-containing protein [Epibacterium ulvae]|uniref:DUF3592 domain-containing protein n=1 Tax=Epibacterium ulvae TaxID=1156985 RepID=UPI0024903F3D|nr:DUF3592 domain-containing protein [Epibacterium ulvae]
MQEFWNDLCAGERYAVLYVCIAYALAVGVFCVVRCFRMRRWPHTLGRLLEEGVSGYGGGGDGMYAARVKYEYSVDGVFHTGTNLSPFIVQATGTRLAKWQMTGIQRHQGNCVTVFYSPRRPHKSYLIVPSQRAIAGLSLLFASVIVVMWLAI